MSKKATSLLRNVLVLALTMVIVFSGNQSLAARQENEGLDPQLQKVVNEALKLEGIKYKSPHHHPDVGFNCDGLVWYSYKEAINHLVPMSPANMEKFGKEITREELRPGDIIVYSFGYSNRPTHIGLYVGNIKGYDKPQIIHAYEPAVSLDNFDRFDESVRSYRRIYIENDAKYADYRVEGWVKARVNNGTQDYDNRTIRTQLRPGTVIKNGIDYGRFVRFEHKGESLYVASSELKRISPLKPLNKNLPDRTIEEPLMKDEGSPYWIKKDVNVRDGQNKIIGRLYRGDKIYALKDGKHYKIDYVKGSREVEARVHQAFVTDENPQAKAYIKARVNVRSQADKKVIGRLQRGQYIYGNLNGNYFEFTYRGVAARVHKNFISDDVYAGGGYIKRNVNVRRVGSGSVVRTYYKGKYQMGRLENGYFYFTLKGEEVRIPESFVQMDRAETKTIKSRVNIRDGQGNYLFSKRAGSKINVVRLGNQYRFYERGRTCFVHHSFVQ